MLKITFPWLMVLVFALSPFALAQVARQNNKTFAAAKNLAIKVGESQASGKELLADGPGWKQAAATSLLLSRTPRVYQTEPLVERPIPRCEVRGLRAQGRLYLRLQWDDATKNAPAAPAARTGEGGDPKVLYKRPTGATASFADAAAVMVPETLSGPEFPSLLMGDRHAPAKLYYWNASTGAHLLKSTGRATPQSAGATVPHRAQHNKTGWVLTLELPDLPAGYPIAFALWDGQFADRDGLKFFSIWYVLRKD